MQQIMNVSSQALAAVACLAICLSAMLLRGNQRQRTAERVDQLNKAAELLEYHARLLAAFLDSPIPPRRLKEILLGLSDVMADHVALADFAAWVVKQATEVGSLRSDDDEIAQLLIELGQESPELDQVYRSAVICGTLGAMLRWPQTTKCFSMIWPTMIADDGRKAKVAVRASHMVQNRSVWAPQLARAIA